MNASLKLTGKYVGKHLRQCIGVVLCISLLAGGVLAALLFRTCAAATSEQRARERHGSYAAVVYDADLSKIEENKELFDTGACAVTGILGSVAIEDVNARDYPYIGTMNEDAMRLAGVPLLAGRLPENSDEIAIEESTLYKLRLEETLGQTVTVQVHTPEGVQTKSYKLVGITGDYITRMTMSDTQQLGIQGVSEPIRLPGIFVGGTEGALQAANVLCADAGMMDRFGGHPLLNGYFEVKDPIQIEDQKKADAAALLLILLFTVVIVIGVYNAAELSVKERERYIGVMRCIGMTRRQAAGLLLCQGVGLAACSLALGAGLGVGFLYAAVGLLRALGQDYLVRFDATAFLYFALLVCGAILLAFFSHSLKLRKKAPLDYGKPGAKPVKKKHAFSSSFPALWGEASAHAYRHQNRLTVLLTAVCVAAAVFGSFLAELIPRNMYQSGFDYYQNTDYYVSVYGGVASKSTFYVGFPRNLGITQAGLERIQNTEGLEVDFAAAERTSKHFFLVPEGTESGFLQQARQNTYFENELTPDVLEQVGAGEGDCLAEADRMMGIDRGILEKLANVVKEGEIDLEAFAAGKEVVTTAPNLQVGDELSIVTVILPEGSTQKYINGEIKVVCDRVRVSAVLDPEKILGSERKRLQDPYILMSSERIFEEDPLAKYDALYIRYTGEDKNSEESLAAEKVIKQVVAQSNGVLVQNLIQDKRDYQNEIRFYRNNCLGIVGFLLLVVLMTLLLTTQIKVNTSLHSYLLMRAVGLDLPTLRRLLFREALRLGVNGILAGGVVGFAACAIIAGNNFYPTLDIFLRTLLPVFLLVSAAVIAIGAFVAVFTAKRLLKKSVAKHLSDVSY